MRSLLDFHSHTYFSLIPSVGLDEKKTVLIIAATLERECDGCFQRTTAAEHLKRDGPNKKIKRHKNMYKTDNDFNCFIIIKSVEINYFIIGHPLQTNKYNSKI